MEADESSEEEQGSLAYSPESKERGAGALGYVWEATSD